MRIALVKETKAHEYRVALLPSQVGLLHQQGHEVWVESGAGLGIGYSDQDYQTQGAQLVPSSERQSLWQQAELILKVKEPSLEEAAWLHAGQMLFTFLHLAPLPALTQALLTSGVTALAYETLTLADGRLPLLAPMSAIAGRMASQIGAQYLQKQHGGLGQLMGAVAGAEAARVAIVGAGVVGRQAAEVALGMGARVTLWDKQPQVLATVSKLLPKAKTQLVSGPLPADAFARSQLVIGAVLVPGAQAPKVIREHHVAAMPQGAVLVDVAIDQGGCSDTSRVTDHDAPVYTSHGVTHYCVANIPGIVARSASQALSQATWPYILQLANQGQQALADPILASAINLHQGRCVQAAVAEAQGLALG